MYYSDLQRSVTQDKLVAFAHLTDVRMTTCFKELDPTCKCVHVHVPDMQMCACACAWHIGMCMCMRLTRTHVHVPDIYGCACA